MRPAILAGRGRELAYGQICSGQSSGVDPSRSHCRLVTWPAPQGAFLVGPGDVVEREGAIGQDLRESWPKEMCLNTFMTRSLSPSLTLRVTPAPAAIAMGTSGSPPPLRLSLVFATASDFFPVGPGVLLRASLWVGVAKWWTPPPAMTVARAASKRKPVPRWPPGGHIAIFKCTLAHSREIGANGRYTPAP